MSIEIGDHSGFPGKHWWFEGVAAPVIVHLLIAILQRQSPGHKTAIMYCISRNLPVSTVREL